MKKLLFLFTIFILNGCVPSNAFKNFYEPINVQPTEGLIFCEQAKVATLPKHDNYGDFMLSMYAKGYIPTGSAAWTGPKRNIEREALEQGQAVKACLVLWRSDYVKTKQHTRTRVNYTPGQNISTYTSSGELETIYIPGTSQTTYEPYSVEEYNYMALFFNKVRLLPLQIGCITDDLPLEYMRARDSRVGVLVTSVMEGSPAYKENIFERDIITKINGEEIYADSPMPLKLNFENILTIDRNGKEMIKKIYLPYNK